MSIENQSVVNVLRTQFSRRQGWLEGTMTDVTDEVAHYTPPGVVNSIAALIAHIATELDFYIIGMTAGKEPLLTSSFAGKSGITELPTADKQHEWLREYGKTIKVDLAALNEYLQAVFVGIDTYLASLTDADLQEEKSVGSNRVVPFNRLDTMMRDISSHTGEISCIKGLQGLKGYPV